MFELSHQLAQDIVDRAMHILASNVNVMDSQGLILGSGEKQRINTRHEGAQLVLANRRVVEIDEQAARNLKGVQPGINLPLMHDNELIGVLGISGDPATLRTHAELVRMTAEMLVDRSHIKAERQWRQQRRENVLALLLGKAACTQLLIDEAHGLGLKPQLKRTPLLIELGEGCEANTLVDWLSAHYPDCWCLSPSSRFVLWCCPSQIKVDSSRLVERLKTQRLVVTRVAHGIQADDIHALRRGCQHVTELLVYGRAMKPDCPYLHLEHWGLLALLWSLREHDAIKELVAPLLKIRTRDGNGQLMRTLRTWCSFSGQSQSCSEALGIHRNSLRYRLERIAELSGKDLSRPDDFVALYLGVQLLEHE